MAHTATDLEERLTQFACECATTLGHDIHPVHFSQNEHIERAVEESLDYATISVVFAYPIAAD